VTSRFFLPTFARRSLEAAQIFFDFGVAELNGVRTTTSSLTSFAPDSIITNAVGGADDHDIQQAFAHFRRRWG